MKSEAKTETKEDRKSMASCSTEKFIEIEDRLAHALTSDEIRKQSTTLIANIRKAISSTPPDLQTAKFLTLELKQLNRLSNFRNQRFKSELQSLQANADSIFLSFNNLANEISHVRKSVVACLNFKSADSDLELVPVEDFIEKGAKEIGFDLAQKDDEHHLRIGRLNYELAQRNAMADTLREQEDLKNLLNSDINAKVKRLKQIRPMIGNIQDAAKPLLDILNLKKVAESTPESRRRAQLLPKELKLLHLYCGVYNQLYPDETLIYGCEGESQAVERFETRRKSATPELEVKMEVDEEEPVEDEEEGPARKRQKTPNKSGQNVQQMRERVFQCHPIALTMAIPCGELLASLHFYYLPDLKCITVKSAVTGKIPTSELFLPEHLFNDLLETDAGKECPSPIGATLLKFVDADIVEHLDTIGKPYRFAQLFSNNASEESTSANSQFDNFKRFVNAIRQRIVDRLTLSDTLQQLTSTNYDRVFPETVKKFEGKSVRMSNAKVDYKLVAPQFDQQTDTEAKEVAQPLFGFQFSCKVDSSPLSLNVAVQIPHSYPRQSPTFALTPRHPIESEHLATALKEFETAINQKILSEDGKFNLLATQMAVLIRRLPVVFQVEGQRKEPQAENEKPLIVENLLFN